jgi:poly(3-hydroxybutyrate) depolymerase
MLSSRRAVVLAMLVLALGPAGAANAALGRPARVREPAASIGWRALYRDLVARRDRLVREIQVPYTAWNGDRRTALLVLPGWYSARVDPLIPLVISPHGRGGTARGNAKLWGDLPAFGPFAVVNPQGQGRRLVSYSWGWRGQISDLARMPQILKRALPWLRIAPHQTYAVGSSMGGQETLLLDALHPRLLAGAVALDSATNMAARFRAFARLRNGHGLQEKAIEEIGGTPRSAPAAYEARSPLTYARILATDRVPLYIWWSRRDTVVVDQQMESGLLYREIKRINPNAPVFQYVGSWAHSAEMSPLSQLPLALVELRLLSIQSPSAASAGPVGLVRGNGGKSRTLLAVEIPPQIPTLEGEARVTFLAGLRVPRSALPTLNRADVGRAPARE